ncbi:unnamed protein product [Heligmosomoides polygyrus]|uniref:Uncharacterized protein n=1 Tax=Heligmosomoides polygyrus TaxID=6339 RepID=A0A183FV15_HELPZ|nr:unnamed protein product [Heligmosomoides polygyrus]
MGTKMMRWTAGVTRLDRIRNDEIRQRFGVAPIADKLREARLRWYGHVLRASGDTVRKIGLNIDVPGKRPKGRPKQRWLDTLHVDLKIQGTKIQDFSQAERDTVEGHTEESSSKDEEYEDDESYEDPALRATSNAAAHRLAQHNEKVRKTRQNPTHQRQILNSRQVKYLDSSASTQQQVFRPQPVQEERYPPFVFRPKPPPPQREPEYNNLLAEIEEYDDFLDQQREYLSRFPKAALQNPYRDLPPGQLPAAGSYSHPRPNPYQLGMLPVPANTIPLVDIQQQPLVSYV